MEHSFEILGDGEMVLIDGCVPRAVAYRMAAMAKGEAAPRSRRWIAAGAMAACVALGAPAAYSYGHHDMAPSVEVFGAKMLTPVVREGDRVVFELLGRRNRLCPQQIEVTFRRDSDDVTVSRANLAGGARAVTAEPLVSKVEFPVPAGLEPGDYHMRRVLYDNCDGKTVAVEMANLAVRVVK